MSNQGPSTPSSDDPTQGVPAPGAGEPPPTGSSSVFESGAPSAGEDPTTVVPTTQPGQGTPPPGGGAGGPGDPGGPGGPGDGEDEFADDKAWYEQPAALVAAGLVGVAAIIVIILLATSGNGGEKSDPTTSSTSSTTSSTTTTTLGVTESACRDGDAGACDQISDSRLQALCDSGETWACQVLLARQGDGEEPEPTPTAAPSDFELCRGGDAGACSRLSDDDIDQLCSEGSDAACQEADIRFESSPYARCQRGEADGCADLDDAGLQVLCDDEGVTAACDEITALAGS